MRTYTGSVQLVLIVMITVVVVAGIVGAIVFVQRRYLFPSTTTSTNTDSSLKNTQGSKKQYQFQEKEEDYLYQNVTPSTLPTQTVGDYTYEYVPRHDTPRQPGQ